MKKEMEREYQKANPLHYKSLPSLIYTLCLSSAHRSNL